MSLLQRMLARKHLKTELFNPNQRISLYAPLNVHVNWVYNAIYSKPYPRVPRFERIARPIHGIQHVTRAAIYIPIFAKLYKQFGDNEALALDYEEMKFLQIAALFHDSAREGEEVDHWDKESALFFYHYATNLLQEDPLKAKLLAEAIANKDAHRENYFDLLDNGTWLKREGGSPKNIYQKLIHDADCLEIIRARPHFDASYLDFYQDIAQFNEEALDLMAKLITEARSLIANQGDTWCRHNPLIKIKYEHQDAYKAIIDFIEHEHNKALYPLMIDLSKDKPNFAPHNEDRITRSVTEKSMTEAMNLGRLFARGIGSPAAFYKERTKDDEYTAALEIRKMRRTLGVPTRTSKTNNREKEGNPNRSVSMIGYGAGVFAGQGFLILNPKIEHISDISALDFGSGWGKKRELQLPQYTPEEKVEQLNLLLRKLKMGGLSIDYGTEIHPITYNEIIYRITEVHAVYFTQDPTLHNYNIYEKDTPYNRHTHYLQALFLQLEYQKASGILLPIYEYSWVHNFIKEAPIYTEDELVAMWVEIVSNLIKVNINFYSVYGGKFIENLKILAIDGYIGEHHNIKKQTSIDINYAPELKKKINKALEEKKMNSLIESFEDGNKLRIFLMSPLDKINLEEREQILAALDGKLGPLIKDIDQLYNLLALPLEKLTTQQRDKIWTAVGSRFDTLIKYKYQLRKLLTLPLEQLNVQQRERILSVHVKLFGKDVVSNVVTKGLFAPTKSACPLEITPYSKPESYAFTTRTFS